MLARFMGPTWGPSGADRTKAGPMSDPWTLLCGMSFITNFWVRDNLSMQVSALHPSPVLPWSRQTWRYLCCLDPKTLFTKRKENSTSNITKSCSTERGVYELLSHFQYWQATYHSSKNKKQSRVFEISQYAVPNTKRFKWSITSHFVEQVIRLHKTSRQLQSCAATNPVGLISGIHPKSTPISSLTKQVHVWRYYFGISYLIIWRK